MNEKQLSKRLITVADSVPKGVKIADIGSDHAYSPCYLVFRDKSTSAIAGEVNEGPYNLAKNQVERLGLSNRIDVRKGNGLKVLEPGEVDVVTIAGMGGGLIRTILDEGKDKLEGVKRLVLQPNVAADVIRIWFKENRWLLISETILEEDEKIYEILVAERGDDSDLYEEDAERKLLLGPFLMQERNETFLKKWRNEVKNWKQILSQLEQATANKELEQKRERLMTQIQMVEEVFTW